MSNDLEIIRRLEKKLRFRLKKFIDLEHFNEFSNQSGFVIDKKGCTEIRLNNCVLKDYHSEIFELKNLQRLIKRIQIFSKWK